MRLSANVLVMFATVFLAVACSKETAKAPVSKPAPAKVEKEAESKAPEAKEVKPDPEAQKQEALKKLAPLAALFQGGSDLNSSVQKVLDAVGKVSLEKCKSTLCSAEELGLKAGHAVAALAGAGEKILRLNNHLRALGDKAPKGLFELPLPANDAAEMPANGAPLSKVAPLEVVTVTDKGVFVTLRPVANLGSDSLASGGEWPGKQVMDVATLTAAKKDEDFKSFQDGMTALRNASLAAAKTMPGQADNSKVEKGKWSALVVVDKALPAESLAAVVRGLGLSGYSDLRYVRGGTHHSVLPAPAAASFIPAAKAGRVEKRALLVNLTEAGADLYEPTGGSGKAPQESEKVALPAEAQRWYKGARLFKTSVSSKELAPLVQTLRAVRQRSSAGTVVLVSANAKVPVERVLSAASAISDAKGPSIQKQLSTVFPGLVCRDEEPTAKSEGCMSLFPVVLPQVNVPAAKGLTKKPVKGEAKPVKPKPEPKAKPNLGVCERSNIKKVIRARRGAFRFCYTRQLQLHQDLTGRVVVRLTVNEVGAVIAAGSSGSMPNKKVHACVVKEARKLRFKPPTEGGRCVINWPFKFKPND